jgi:hypothetical protein
MMLSKQINIERCDTLKRLLAEEAYTNNEELEELTNQLAACEAWQHPFESEHDTIEQTN